MKFTGVFLALCLSVVFSARAQSTNLTQQILRMPTFREGLILTGDQKPGEAENKELLEVLNHLQEPWWTAGLEQFFKDHPHSPWSASLHYDYASFCHRTGRTTKALEQYEAAWDLTKNDATQNGQYLGGTTLAHWMDLLSNLGRLDQLKELMKVGDHWHFINPRDRDMYEEAVNAYYTMQAHPGIAYRCGTFALKAVGQRLQPNNRKLERLISVPSPTNGFSMAALLDMSGKYGLNLAAVRREPGQELIVPSVVHWRQNHYAAILEKRDDLYLVSDPTFGWQKWITRDVIDEESSGEFLVPANLLTNGWTRLARNDLEKIHGMGLNNSIRNGPDKGCQPGGPCPACPGMPVWWVTEPYIDLWMADEPISYRASRGDSFTFRMTYKQRDTRAVEYLPVDAFLQCGWNNSWFSFITIEYTCNFGSCPLAVPGGTATTTLYLPNGGAVDFSDGKTYDSSTRLSLLPLTGSFNKQGADNGEDNLQVVHADGSVDVYGSMVGNSALYNDTITADYVMTRHIDPHGDTTWFIYSSTNFSGNNYGILQYVIDPDGRTNTLTYINPGVYQCLLSEVDNPYGLSAKFKYDNNYNLTNITDAQGLSSGISYGVSNYPTALTTLYGTSRFSLVDNGISYGGGALGNAGGDANQLIDRSALVVDPTGATNLYMYRYDSALVMTATNFPDVPTNTPLGTLDTGAADTNDDSGLNAVCFRNSFHWGPRQYANLSTENMSNFLASDYLLGRMQHWLQDTDDLYVTEELSVKRDPSPSASGATTGLFTFYDYQGKTETYREGTNSLPSVVAWCLPGGETHYEYKLYDYYGNVIDDITTYTRPDGSLGTRTNQFIYANNTYTHLVGAWYSGTGLYPSTETSFTIPNLLTQIIGADGNTIWTYGDFDTVSTTNVYHDPATHATNGEALIWSRVLPDYATNGLGQVASFNYTAGTIPITNLLYTNTADTNFVTAFSGLDKIASYTSVSGLTTTNVYNASGFLTQTINLQTGRTNSFGYTANGLVGTFTNELGLNLTLIWDNLLRLTDVDYPDGTSEDVIYSKLDPHYIYDRLGNQIVTAYDNDRRLSSITWYQSYYVFTDVTFDWCGCGALTGFIDQMGQETSFNYDNAGNLTNVDYPDSSALNYQYDLAGRVTNVLDGAGRTLQVTYNNQGLVSTVSNAYGLVQGTIYDIRDRPISLTDANGVTVTNTYDPLDRVLTRTWPDGIGEGYGYSARGLAFYTNRDNRVTRYGRDVAGRLVAVTNANSEIVQAAYNPANEITNLIDGLGHVTGWQYNQYGWLTNKVDGLGRNAFQFVYDPDGHLTNRWTPEKGNTSYTYDYLGNVISIANAQWTNTYTYDLDNRLTNLLDSVGNTAFGYTLVGQLASETTPWTNVISYHYSQGLRTNLSIGSPSWAASYTYDSAWRMTGVSAPAGTFNYSYGFQAASPLVTGISLPNGATITNSYDSLARLTQTGLENHWGHVLDGYTYAMDPLGLRTNILRNLGLTSSSVKINYDAIGQVTDWLAKETNGTARLNEQLGFGYDAADNLNLRTNNALVQTFTVDAANELTGVSRSGTFTLDGSLPAPATNIMVNRQAAQAYADFTFASANNTLANGNNTFTSIAQNVYGLAVTNTASYQLPTANALAYDNDGNLTNDGTRAFAYDDEDQLTNITLAGQWRTDFVIDGLGRRRIVRDYSWNVGTSSWQKTNEVRYLYDGLLAIQERDTTNNVLVTYTRGRDFSGGLSGAGGIGGLLARTDATNGTTFYHADGNGNITALMDGNENIIARYLYNPYGKLLGQWGSLAGANEMQFSSMPQHRGIALYPFRGYEPNFQRWLNRDPIQEWGGINLYRFVGNNPLNWFDPLGLADGIYQGGPYYGYSGDSIYAPSAPAYNSSIYSIPPNQSPEMQANLQTMMPWFAAIDALAPLGAASLGKEPPDAGDMNAPQSCPARMGKGIVNNGQVVAHAPIESVTSHEQLANQSGTLLQAPQAGTPGSLVPGAEAFTYFAEGNEVNVTGSMNFNYSVSDETVNTVTMYVKGMND